MPTDKRYSINKVMVVCMATSAIFTGNIEISALLKKMDVDQSLIIEVADGYTVNDAMKAITASSPVRRKARGKFNKPVLQIDVKLDTLTAISGPCHDKLSKLLRITKTAEYFI